jgi:hypothetical protein
MGRLSRLATHPRGEARRGSPTYRSVCSTFLSSGPLPNARVLERAFGTLGHDPEDTGSSDLTALIW